jgi:hypothetical protein
MTDYLGFYYKVGNKVFYNKIEAVLYANTTLTDITWHYNDELFSSLDWTVEPTTSLDEFYKIRANQIRDNYDYVVILCSGGADSTNVVKTFLENNITIDEIIAAAPMSGLRDYNFNDNDTTHLNTMSETKYAQLPLIHDITFNYTNIKITLHDYFEEMINYKTDEWLYQSEDWIHPSSVARYRYERHKHLKDLAESGKRIAFVYGIDKPWLSIGRDNCIYTIFSDLTVNTQRQPFDKHYPNVENVLFYWSATLPQLMIKQAHEVSRWIFKPENGNALQYLQDRRIMMNWSWELNRYRHSKYERAIVPCLYPSTHKKIFQAEKPIKLFLGEHDGWFYKHHSKTHMYEMIISDVSHFYKNINEKYLNAEKNGFVTYMASYKIGELSNFHPLSYAPI